MMKNCILLLAFLTVTLSVSAQGFYPDNYSGSLSTRVNPARTFSKKIKLDVMLFNLDVYTGSNYYTISGDEIWGGDSEYFNNVELRVQGPSFLLGIGERNAIGFSFSGNLNMITSGDSALFRAIENNQKGIYFPDPVSANFMTTSWAEYAFSYARLFPIDAHHSLVGGANLRIIQSIGAGGMRMNNMRAVHDQVTDNVTVTGDMYTILPEGVSGNSASISLNDFEVASQFTAGVDLGVTYEWKKKEDATDYDIKAELAWINVMGSKINMGKITRENYDANSTFTDSTWNLVDLDNMDDYFNITKENISDYKVALDERINVSVDGRIKEKFYVSAFSSIALNKDELYRGTSFYVTPRYEAKLFGALLPLGMTPEGNMAVGLGLRLGPLVLGTENILAAFNDDSLGDTSIYLGLKWAFFKNRKKNKEE